jgi:hypothetical protein
LIVHTVGEFVRRGIAVLDERAGLQLLDALEIELVC